MSMIQCDGCWGIVDTDDDPEGFRTEGGKDKFYCEACREREELEEEADGDDLIAVRAKERLQNMYAPELKDLQLINYNPVQIEKL